MNNPLYVKSILCGNSRKKTQEIIISIASIEKNDVYDYSVRMIITGISVPQDRTLKACSEFDCLVIAMSFLRQHLRRFCNENSGLKLYEKITEKELFEISIDELFGTQDCITDEMKR